MTIKNKGPKIISIGTEVLMPDSEMSVTQEVADTPAIQAFVRLGFVEVVDDSATKMAKAAKSPTVETEKKATEQPEAESAEKKATVEEPIRKRAAGTVMK